VPAFGREFTVLQLTISTHVCLTKQYWRNLGGKQAHRAYPVSVVLPIRLVSLGLDWTGDERWPA